MSNFASKNIRPSNLHRRERCPGSLRMEQNLPEPIMDADAPASRGNRLHEAISKGLRSPAERIAILAECDDADIVTACWEESEQLWNGLAENVRSRAKVCIERVVDLSGLGMDKGTLDFAIIALPTESESGVMVVRDWKTGMGYVPYAKSNLQLLAYVYGLIAELGYHETSTAIDIGIFQPAVRDMADKFVTNAEHILSMSDKINTIVARCESDDAPIIPGGWCQYCRAAESCETRLTVAAEVKGIAKPVEAIKALTGSARREMYDKLNSAIKMLEDAQEQINTAVLSGEITIDGYEVGEGRKTRAWADEAKAIEQLYALGTAKGIPDSVIQPISIPQAEKLFGKGQFDDLTLTKVGKPMVVRTKAGKK